MFYQNAYPVTAVACGLYPIRYPDRANLAPLRDGDLSCMAQRVVEHFEGALRGQGRTPTRRQKLQRWEERVHESGATVDDVAELEEKILKRAIVLRELIVQNCHALSNQRPSLSPVQEVDFYDGDVWHLTRVAINGALPRDVGTGFAEVHPFIPAWFGKHFADAG